MSRKARNPHVAKVVEAQKALAARDPKCRYVDTAGADVANVVHFSAAGMLEVGKRFAEALRQAEAAMK